MPIYEYHCTTCDKEFEVITFSTKNEKISCTNCGSTEVRKLLSASTIKTGVAGLENAPSPAGCGTGSGFS